MSATVEGRLLAANAPLLLDDPETAWVVGRGRAQVFLVLRAADGPSPRWPLFSVGSGELILGPPPSVPVGLVVVGIEDGSAALPVELAVLKKAVADGDESVRLVERWLEQLAASLEVPLPEDGESLTVGEATQVAAGTAVWPAMHTVWVESDAPLVLYGDHDRASSGIVLPLPPQAWAVAKVETVLRPADGALALGDDRGWAGLETFQHAAFTRLLRLLESAGAESAERIEKRRAYEDDLRADTYTALGAVLAHRSEQELVGDADALLGAMRLVGRSLGVEVVAPPRGASGGVIDPLEAIARASGVRTRRVILEDRWWRNDVGTLLGRLAEGGQAVALIPKRPGVYELVDPAAHTRVRLDETVARTLDPEATMVYRPLPPGALSGRDVWRFVMRPIVVDLRSVFAFGLVGGALSLVTPIVTKRIFGTVVPGLQRGNLIWLTVLLGVFAVSAFGFTLAQQFALLRLEGRASADLQAAVWDRLLDLPLPFFRRFSAGSLTLRVMGIEQIRSLATATVATAALAIPIAIANLVLAFVFAPRLAAFGLIAVVILVTSMILLARFQVQKQARIQQAGQELFAIAIQLVDAIGKLRVADAEQRAYAQWAKRFAALKQSFFGAQLGFAAITSFTAAGTALATLFFFIGAATMKLGTLSGATFIAFNVAFLQVMAATAGLTSIATFFAQAIPLYANTQPVLIEPRETDLLRTDPGELRGTVEMSHVSFRYGEDGPLVLDDVSFKAEPGEFVAFVGPSGAGKSSVLRVLLGFEEPEVGSVSYDGKDLESLDPRALRQQMGVVIQTARLLPGDIFTNIVGARPLTMDDAWEAVRIAGLEREIKELPMGMHTFVAEGAGSFSGGQRQRLLIARAVVGRPRILLFDEATSALDNRTQQEVSEAIERLRATRIVIAHRLSTVRRADRILVLVAGRIVQSGTYDELIAVEGPFQRLAKRQLV